MNNFDYVIVGGGAAASVVAYRLGERGHRVCVLEAGPLDTNPYIRIPAGFIKTLGDARVTWQMMQAGSPGTNGRPIPMIQGKTLGGSSAINGAVYSRGQALDFDTWAELGNEGWAYRDVLTYFRRNEQFLSGGDSHYRGRHGSIPVTTTGWRDEICEAFVEGAVSCGIPRNDDYNGQDQTGVGYCQSYIYNGRRWSAAHGYLHPARKRHGVVVMTNAKVTRILVENRRATGVAYRLGDSTTTVSVAARRAVIVCAGSVHSPKLLQLSGIGPGSLLQSLGIPVVHDLPGVGENLRDHYTARLVTRARPGIDSINGRVRGLRLAREVLAWACRRNSVLALSPILLYTFWKSVATLPSPDFAITFTPASYKQGMLGRLDDYPGLTCGAWQLRPESRGHVRAFSADDRVDPIIQPNFLDDERDRQVIVAALKWARKLLKTESMQRIVEAELLPGSDVQSDDEWLDFMRQYGMTGYHLVGTCKMGNAADPMAVVDSQLRVHGIGSLRVIDASIMPTIPSANTCASTMMIAEKGADMILAAN